MSLSPPIPQHFGCVLQKIKAKTFLEKDETQNYLALSFNGKKK